MKKNLLIIGASGHGKVVVDIALKMGKWKSIAFLDDNTNVKSVMGIKVIGRTKDAFSNINDSDIFVGIGDNDIRKKILESLEDKGAIIPTLIHPNATIGEQVKIEKGTVVMPGAIINCSTRIGKGCIINTGATIDHDNEIEDYVHLSPGTTLAGNVKVGKSSWLGTRSTVINNINITERCVIGAGTVVVEEIKMAGTYVGVPARRIS
ncbi:acetyltransferase [Fictibacillus enclensis]|uniref:acetyltransferase n=1 Tax=Fictibacillus enclensis TaxID=1017270 RepID=UPI0025A1BE45|nr:acetyltransferase [Fictibacillus enclensis]MDM5201144.1 acetyltransferase [Fictibacillus enclensis]